MNFDPREPPQDPLEEFARLMSGIDTTVSHTEDDEVESDFIKPGLAVIRDRVTRKVVSIGDFTEEEIEKLAKIAAEVRHYRIFGRWPDTPM